MHRGCFLETENIGIEKIIKNILANSAIRFLICAGAEPPRHLPGATLLSLFKNGIDDARRIPAAPGMRPLLPNTTHGEAEAFRQQAECVDMIGCADIAVIAAKVEELLARVPIPAISQPRDSRPALSRQSVPRIVAQAPRADRIKLDKAGYFVITIAEVSIIVEHYDYKERLLHVIEGTEARTIYWTFTSGWVTQLDHAAYLGKELARAELSLRHGIEFEQDEGRMNNEL